MKMPYVVGWLGSERTSRVGGTVQKGGDGKVRYEVERELLPKSLFGSVVVDDLVSWHCSGPPTDRPQGFVYGGLTGLRRPIIISSQITCNLSPLPDHALGLI